MEKKPHITRKSLLWQIPLLVLLVVGTFFIARQHRAETQAARQQEYRHNEGFIFGTVYNLTYQADADLHESVVRALGKIDAEFSMFNEKSTISAINRGESPKRSEMFEEVYKLAMDINADTEGAFDVTVAPLVNAWGFGFKNEKLPTPEQVDSLLAIRSQMDFSAIAKGYGCDVAARVLREQGVKNFMVEIGGEVVTSGVNPQGEAWHIGVSRPEEGKMPDTSDLQAVVAVSDAALATSGNYRNFYYRGGRKYAHTIDPRTGYPVQHELLSATVFAPSCAMADAYATAFMVMGLEPAKKLLEKHPEMKAYLIYTDKDSSLREWVSPGLNVEAPNK